MGENPFQRLSMLSGSAGARHESDNQGFTEATLLGSSEACQWILDDAG